MVETVESIIINNCQQSLAPTSHGLPLFTFYLFIFLCWYFGQRYWIIDCPNLVQSYLTFYIGYGISLCSKPATKISIPLPALNLCTNIKLCLEIILRVGTWCRGIHEIRCVRRKVLLETLERELPRGSIRYSSKVVSIQESGHYKTVHLADGSVLKTKVNSSWTAHEIRPNERGFYFLVACGLLSYKLPW